MVEIEKQKVVIIGHGATSRLGIVRALSELGCKITVIVMSWFRGTESKLDNRKPYDCYSKYITKVYYCYAKDGEGLIQLLLNKCADSSNKAILLPDSDFSAAIIDDNQKVLAPFFLFPSIGNRPGAIRYWMNKEVQKDLAHTVGLNVSKANVIEIKNGKYSIPDDIKYPCFTKALVTINGGKHLFKRCNNIQDLHSLLESIPKNQDIRLLVEDYKEIDTEYATMGFSDGENVIIPGVITFIENAKSHFGVAMNGRIGPISGFEDLLERFKLFVQKVGFVGVFDIDFFSSGNELYFGEMNLRFGASGYAITKMGVNLPVMLVKYLRGEDITYMKKTISGSSIFVNERMCEEDWYLNIINSKDYFRLIRSADICFVADDRDKQPQIVFQLVHLVHFFKKKLHLV